MNLKLTNKYTKKDIERLIRTGAEESTYLEFKHGNELIMRGTKTMDDIKHEIAKDVSAFANADGGLLIYGVEEKNHKAHDWGFVDGNKFTKEWLEQVIESRIFRKIEGLEIDPIRVDKRMDQTIYVVKIPRSTNAPHYTKDKSFYKRRNFKVDEMEEYEIRESYNRQDKTQLIIDPLINHADSGETLRIINISVEINVKNIGKTIEKLYKVELHVPFAIASDIINGHPELVKGFNRHEKGYYIFSFPNKSALFPDEISSIVRFNFIIRKENYEIVNINLFLIKLYDTSGTQERNINILDHVNYKGRRPTIEDFSPYQSGVKAKVIIPR